jgi:lysophospholipase L1-like esterase
MSNPIRYAHYNPDGSLIDDPKVSSDLSSPELRNVQNGKFPNRWALVGDSRLFPSQPISSSFRSVWNMVQAILGYRFNLVANAAVAGYTTSDMLATLDEQVLSTSPSHVIVFGGTNNIAIGGAAGATQALEDLTGANGIYSKILATGATVVACLEYPASAVYTTAEKREALHILNSGIIEYARYTTDVIVVDFFDRVINTASATGDNITSLLHDGVHLSASGSIYCAYELAAAIQYTYPQARKFSTSLTDIVSATFLKGNIVANGAMSGTGGSNAGTGMSGVVATSWAHQLESGTATSVASKVNRTDGYTGEWQRLTVSAGANDTAVRLLQFALVPAALSAGDFVELFVEFNLSSVVGNILGLCPYIQWLDGSSGLLRVDFAPFPEGDPLVNFSGVLRMPPVEIPTGAFLVLPAIRLQMNNGASCVLDVGRFELRKV